MPRKKFLGTDKETGGPKHQCQQAPEREKAINNGFAFLSSYAKDYPGFESLFSVVTFPSLAATNQGYDIRTTGSSSGVEGWVKATADQSTAVAKAASEATRNPFGLTPIGGGIEGASKLFSSLPESNKLARLVFFITDGFPTDENAAEAKAKAENLRKKLSDKGMGVDRVVTLLVGNQAAGAKENVMLSLIAPKILGGLGQERDNAQSLLGLGSYQGKGLVDVLSDSYVTKNSPSEIEAVFVNEIQKAVECN